MNGRWIAQLLAAPAWVGALLTVVVSARGEPVTPWNEAGVVDTARSPHAVLRAVPIRAVTMEPGFWRPKMEANRTVSIPRLLKLLEEKGVVDNFRRLSGRKQCERRGYYFTDSDLYKWMESAALALQSADDPAVKADLDRIIDEVLAIQGSDGYINTWFEGPKAKDRFKQLPSHHELYCAGHLFQAAVAHYRATGERKLLDGALRFADYLVNVFGPDKPFQGFDGHPEVEMALVELYRTTGKQGYLELAEYYLDGNGYARRKGVEGHAVRMMYLCCGATDFFAETGREDYQQASLALWQDMVAGKLYVTGGVGARGSGEAFGEPFELPNRTAYSETCASIANGMWNWRMLAVTGEAKYMDLFERVLYNAFLSGVSIQGGEYFYVNPLANDGRHRRRDWYDCTCCPPNVQRTMAAIPGHVFTTSDKGVQVHLYDNCVLKWKLADGTPLVLRQKTSYPWDGAVEIDVAPQTARTFDLDLRIPGWCRKPALKVNGQPVGMELKPGTYARVSREWKTGDRAELT
ncbi:MAG: glycoside hydrolase family 127 protein, partial [Phycisphaerae bacterium]